MLPRVRCVQIPVAGSNTYVYWQLIRVQSSRQSRNFVQSSGYGSTVYSLPSNFTFLLATINNAQPNKNIRNIKRHCIIICAFDSAIATEHATGYTTYGTLTNVCCGGSPRDLIIIDVK